MNEEQEQPQPQFLEYIFKIKMKVGKEFVEEIYLYNFNKMSASRMLQGANFFSKHQESDAQLPKTPDEVLILAVRQMERHAFGALLMRVLDEEMTDFEIYDPVKSTSIAAMDYIAGKQEYEKLQECKSDFFTHIGLQPVVSQRQSEATMNILQSCRANSPEVYQDVMRLLIKP